MKTIFYILLGISTANSYAFQMDLEQFDQEKLADLVNRLPLSVRTKDTSEIQGPVRGISVRSEFPKEDLGFRVVCESKFYNDSPYPSSSTCSLAVDEHHPQVDKNYDEFKVEIDEEKTASALFDHISYGRPFKDFRSFGKDEGTSYEGKDTWIFHYRFRCSPTACELFISERIGKGVGETRSKRL